MADAAGSYGAAQAHAAPVQGAYPAGPGGQPPQTQPLTQPQPQQLQQQQAPPQIPVPQYAAAPAGSVPIAHPVVATVPVGAPPIPPTIVGNQAPQDPPPRRRARRATPASRGGRTRRAVAAPAPAAAMHPQQGLAAGPLPTASMPTGAPAGNVGMAAPALANAGGMTQPSTDMWNQYSQAVNEFMSMQSKTIDKLLDRTYTTNHSVGRKKSVQIDEAETVMVGEDEVLASNNATMDVTADGNEDEDAEEEIQEKAPVARAKRTRRPASRKVASKVPVMKSRQDSDEDDTDADAEELPQRKMSRNGHAESSRPLSSAQYETAAPSPGHKRYDDGGAIDLASYYK